MCSPQTQLNFPICDSTNPSEVPNILDRSLRYLFSNPAYILLTYIRLWSWNRTIQSHVHVMSRTAYQRRQNKRLNGHGGRLCCHSSRIGFCTCRLPWAQPGYYCSYHAQWSDQTTRWHTGLVAPTTPTKRFWVQSLNAPSLICKPSCLAQGGGESRLSCNWKVASLIPGTS